MKTITIAPGLMLAFALIAAGQQPFDFRSLDKLDALTEHKTKVTLDGDLLKLAARFLGASDDKDAAAIKSLVNNLKGVYVRSYEFDKAGQYNPADLEPLRSYLKQQQWAKIVETQDGKDYSEVYIQPLPNDRFGGVAIISAEARELTVVYISGVMNLSDLDKLQGNMGIPDIDLKNAKKPGAQNGKEKKEDEE
jgi:hypothetical protein